MFLNTGNLLSFWYKNNQYSNDKLSGDLENIKAYYLNHGYINFKVNSVQVQLSEDKKYVYIICLYHIYYFSLSVNIYNYGLMDK